MSYQPRYNEQDAYDYFKRVRAVQHANNAAFLTCKGVHGYEPTESLVIPTVISKNEAASYYRSLNAAKLRHHHQIFNYNTLDKIEAHEPKATVTVLESKLLDRFIKPEEEEMAQIDQADPDAGAAANPESLEAMSGMDGPPPEGSVKDNIQQMKLYDTDAQNIELARQKLMSSLAKKMEEYADEFEELETKIQMTELDAVKDLAELLNLEELDGKEFAEKAIELVGSIKRPAFSQGNPGDLPGSVRDANAPPMADADETIEQKLEEAGQKYEAIMGSLKIAHSRFDKILSDPRLHQGGVAVFQQATGPVTMEIQRLTLLAQAQLDLMENTASKAAAREKKPKQAAEDTYTQQWLQDNGPQVGARYRPIGSPEERAVALRSLAERLAEIKAAAKYNDPTLGQRLATLDPLLQNLGASKSMGVIQLHQDVEELRGLQDDVGYLQQELKRSNGPETAQLRGLLASKQAEFQAKQKQIRDITPQIGDAGRLQLDKVDHALVNVLQFRKALEIKNNPGKALSKADQARISELAEEFNEVVNDVSDDIDKVAQTRSENIAKRREELQRSLESIEERLQEFENPQGGDDGLGSSGPAAGPDADVAPPEQAAQAADEEPDAEEKYAEEEQAADLSKRAEKVARVRVAPKVRAFEERVAMILKDEGVGSPEELSPEKEAELKKLFRPIDEEFMEHKRRALAELRDEDTRRLAQRREAEFARSKREQQLNALRQAADKARAELAVTDQPDKPFEDALKDKRSLRSRARQYGYVDPDTFPPSFMASARKQLSTVRKSRKSLAQRLEFKEDSPSSSSSSSAAAAANPYWKSGIGKRKSSSRSWKGDPALERFDLLVGMREEGNNSPEIVQEIKSLIQHLLANKVVSPTRIRNRLKKMDQVTSQELHQG